MLKLRLVKTTGCYFAEDFETFNHNEHNVTDITNYTNQSNCFY